MKRLWCVLAVAALGVGCGAAAPPAWVYVKPGVSEAELREDERVCLERSIGRADSEALPTFADTVSRDAFNDCMRQRGYDVRSGSVAASPR